MPDPSGLYAPLDVSAVPVLLSFVVDLLAPGTDDLFPELFGNTIDFFWESSGREVQQGKGLQSSLGFGQALLFFSKLLKGMHHTHYANRLRVVQLLETIHDHGLFDLVARHIILMDPTETDFDSEDIDGNETILSYMDSLLENIKKFAPTRLREAHFTKWILDWENIMNFLLLRQAMLNLPDSDAIHFRACIDQWYEVGEALGLRDRIKATRDLRISCFNLRCPDPNPLGGARLVCSLCYVTMYCSYRCQKQDWLGNGSSDSHRRLCSGR
ncbi:hypothetical protein BDV93DRAFT_525022 [Ceratobasidium sp. AG-I]|nr:hypothetical protein BDV93DRAFT_525022 [Ceratobasidium sp. AG-I]